MGRRIVLLLTAGAVMALVVAFSGVATAAPECTTVKGEKGTRIQTCVETVTETTFETTAATRSCEVGNSGRMGTQEGTSTQEFQQTTTTTTTTVFKGGSGKKIISGPTTDTVVGPKVPVGDPVFTPTGGCKNNPGPQ